MKFPIGEAYFHGRTVCFREGKLLTFLQVTPGSSQRSRQRLATKVISTNSQAILLRGQQVPLGTGGS